MTPPLFQLLRGADEKQNRTILCIMTFLASPLQLH